MPKFYRLDRRIESKELTVALQEFATALQGGEVDAQTKFRLHLTTTHRAAIEILFAHVPAQSRGFQRLGHEANFNAAEMAAELGDHGDWSYSGEVPAAGFARLLSELNSMKPDPLRRTAVSIDVAHLRLRGSDPDSIGHLSLDDAKVFGRKIRFTLTTGITHVTDRSASLRAAEFAAIKAHTTVDFAKAKVTVLPEADLKPWAKLPAACLLVDHCSELVSRELRTSGFDWRSLPGIFPNFAGVEYRFRSYGQGSAENFRWESRISQFVRETLPEFRNANVESVAGYFYSAHLAPGWQLLLHFDTAPGSRIGRVFKLKCGVRSADATRPAFARMAPVFGCAGAAFYSGTSYESCTDLGPEFAFNTRGELDQILEGLGRFMPDYVRRLREWLEKNLEPGLRDLASVLPVNGNLSAREAWALACQEIGSEVESDLSRVRLFGTVDSLHYRADTRAQLPADGRLTPFHGWEFELAGESSFLVRVPFAGVIKRMNRPVFPGVVSPAPSESVGRSWQDSPAVALEMATAMVRLRQRYAPMTGVIGMPTLGQESDGPMWRCQLEFSGRTPEGGGWVRVEHFMNANTGRPSHTLFDERFPDRATPNREFTERASSDTLR